MHGYNTYYTENFYLHSRKYIMSQRRHGIRVSYGLSDGL